MLDDDLLEQLLDIARANPRWAHIEPVVLTAFDTGMRKSEVLKLRRNQVDWRHGIIRLGEQDTKGEAARVVALQQRTLAALEAVPQVLRSPFIFANPRTRKASGDFKRAWRSACRELASKLREAGREQQAELVETAWVHDLRHSFCTWARPRGLAESVVMQSSGHRTRAVFDRYNLVDESHALELARRMEEARAAESTTQNAARQPVSLGKNRSK